MAPRGRRVGTRGGARARTPRVAAPGWNPPAATSGVPDVPTTPTSLPDGVERPAPHVRHRAPPARAARSRHRDIYARLRRARAARHGAQRRPEPASQRTAPSPPEGVPRSPSRTSARAPEAACFGGRNRDRTHMRQTNPFFRNPRTLDGGEDGRAAGGRAAADFPELLSSDDEDDDGAGGADGGGEGRRAPRAESTAIAVPVKDAAERLPTEAGGGSPRRPGWPDEAHSAGESNRDDGERDHDQEEHGRREARELDLEPREPRRTSSSVRIRFAGRRRAQVGRRSVESAPPITRTRFGIASLADKHRERDEPLLGRVASAPSGARRPSPHIRARCPRTPPRVCPRGDAHPAGAPPPPPPKDVSVLTFERRLPGMTDGDANASAWSSRDSHRGGPSSIRFHDPGPIRRVGLGCARRVLLILGGRRRRRSSRFPVIDGARPVRAAQAARPPWMPLDLPRVTLLLVLLELLLGARAAVGVRSRAQASPTRRGP